MIEPSSGLTTNTLAPPPCRNCGSTEWTPVLTGHGFDDAAERFAIAQCARCGLARTEPVLSGEQLGAYYAASYYGSSQAKFNSVIEGLVLRFSSARARALMRLVRVDGGGRSARALDIGCGRGTFLRHLRQLGAECTGTEISSFAHTDQANGITFLQGRIEDLALPASHFDLVTIWHVLEHTTDPAATVAEMARIAAPGGLVAIAVPNFGSMQRRIFGKHWFHLDLPRHTHHFSLPVLQAMLRAKGLTPVSIGTHSGEQNFYGFVQSALNATFPWRAPNALYKFLKVGRHGHTPPGERILLALDILLTIPYGILSVVENVISVASRQGATAIVYARKD